MNPKVSIIISLPDGIEIDRFEIESNRFADAAPDLLETLEQKQVRAAAQLASNIRKTLKLLYTL